MDSIKLQHVLKKWRKFAAVHKTNTKKNMEVPKGYLALCVGIEMKRFVIPMDFLRHEAFGVLLQEAEEEFGFQNEGVLRIPCGVQMFENVLRMVDKRNKTGFWQADLSQACLLQNHMYS